MRLSSARILLLRIQCLLTLMLPILLLIIPTLGYSQVVIETFPHAKVVSEEVLSTTQNFELTMGPVKRINSLLRPESLLVVRGKKQAITLLSSKRRNAEEIFQHYLDQLSTGSEVLFQCIGRSCGPSTYWANRIYENALLYGPEQYQRYLFAKIDASQSDYLVIYIGQRATGQVYIQHEVIFSEVTEDQMNSILAETGRYILPQNIDEKLIGQIENVIASTQSQYVLVVHDKLLEGESFDRALGRTDELARQLKKRFNNQKTLSQIRFYGAGPISPLTGQLAERIELIKLR